MPQHIDVAAHLLVALTQRSRQVVSSCGGLEQIGLDTPCSRLYADTLMLSRPQRLFTRVPSGALGLESGLEVIKPVHQLVLRHDDTLQLVGRTLELLCASTGGSPELLSARLELVLQRHDALLLLARLLQRRCQPAAKLSGDEGAVALAPPLRKRTG